MATMVEWFGGAWNWKRQWDQTLTNSELVLLHKLELLIADFKHVEEALDR